jgi:preprotein translocase subunit YajC
MTMIKFEDISFLYGLLAIPVFFVMFYLMMQQRKKRLKKTRRPQIGQKTYA